jgi:hypothetical protein
MTHPRRLLILAALLGLAVLLPARASAATLVPFQATVDEHYTVTPCGPTTICIQAAGSGEATHLGQITEDSQVMVDTNPADSHDGCPPETRTTVLTAANGDTLTMSATGYGQGPCNGANTAQDSYVVTGGTGRFAGATGSGTDRIVFTLTGPGVGTAVVTYNGDLSTVGSFASAG